MSAEPLRPVYLLVGSDRPKISRALRRLRSRFGEEAVELLAAEEASGVDAVAACNALGLFATDAGGRLVIVEGVERWKAGDAEAVAAYAGDPAEGAVLALVASELPKHERLVKAAAKAGQLLEYNVPKPRDPTTWVRSELERLGVRAEADVARALVDIVGDDVTTLESEIEKLAAWAGDGPLAVDDVRRLAAAAREAEPWALTDAWGARDLPGLLRACELALEQRDAFGLAVALATHLTRVRKAQRLAGEGLSVRDVAKRLRVKEYPARKAMAHGENYTQDELDAAIVRLAALDAALKGASRLAGELELQRALVEITSCVTPVAAGSAA